MESITDELREWTRTHTVNCSDNRIALVAIADRIDEAHEAKVSYWQGASYKDGYENGYDDGFASAGDWTEHGWVRLPVDADGVPIHIGDVMEWCDSGDTLTVEGIGKDIVFYIENEGAEWTAARNKRHHEPTVEDVLREFAERYLDYEGVPSAGRRGIGEALMDEYAARLRLAGDAE